MKRLVLISAFFLGGVAFGPALTAAEDDAYKIIVHPGNPATFISKTEASAIFLKKTYRWSYGPNVLAVEPKRSSHVRERFSMEIHGKPVSSVMAYWMQQIFAGKGLPPPEKATDAEIVGYVKATPGSIGYVSASADVSGVKVLAVKD
jgi:ABC-type phosphate transport system substrate-binding protein